MLSECTPTELVAEIERLRGRIHLLESALIWCSGSADFGPGGIAHDAFVRMVRPLLAHLEPFTGLPSESEGSEP